jgi:hypothetical protein
LVVPVACAVRRSDPEWLDYLDVWIELKRKDRARDQGRNSVARPRRGADCISGDYGVRVREDRSDGDVDRADADCIGNALCGPPMRAPIAVEGAVVHPYHDTRMS